MPLNVEVLQQSFERVKPRADEFAASFYENLFNLYPEVKPLFAKTDMANQYKKLLNALVLVVENLRNPEALGEVLKALGGRHVGYGAIAKYYPAVGKALLVTFEQYLQEDWTPEVRQAWVNAYKAITVQMLKGAGVAQAPEDVQSETGAIPEKQVAAATSPPAEPKQEEVPDSAPAGLPVEVLISSFEKIKPRADEFAASFYENLFKLYPEVKPLFAKTDMANQYKKLLNSLVLVVENLRNPEALGQVLDALGARHVGYGALAIHYPAVGEALLATFEQYLQKDWTPEVKQAWVTAFGAITAQMLKGAGEESSPEVVAEQPAAPLEEPSELKAELKKEAEPLQPQAESQKKPLVSIQWDGESLQGILGKIAERYQQFQTQPSVQQWGDTLKQLPGKLTDSQLFKTPLSAERLGEILQQVTGRISDIFWGLPAPAVAVLAAIIMTGFFLVAEENSLLAEILEGADAISLLVALVLFIKEGPERRKQFHYQAWGAVDAAHGVKVSNARILALQDLNEDGVSLRGLDAAGAELVEINLPRANLSDANLRGSDLSEANLSYANLDNANISQAKLVSANLSHAKLGFARLSKTNLSSANLNYANLICADLSQANLSGANLSHASLSGANLEGAYLSGANLKDAKVSVYELSSAFLDGAIMPDGSIYQSQKDSQ